MFQWGRIVPPTYIRKCPFEWKNKAIFLTKTHQLIKNQAHFLGQVTKNKECLFNRLIIGFQKEVRPWECKIHSTSTEGNCLGKVQRKVSNSIEEFDFLRRPRFKPGLLEICRWTEMQNNLEDLTSVPIIYTEKPVLSGHSKVGKTKV